MQLTQVASMNHVRYTTRRTNQNMCSRFKSANVMIDIGSTDTCMAFDIQIVTQCNYNFLDLVLKHFINERI